MSCAVTDCRARAAYGRKGFPWFICYRHAQQFNTSDAKRRLVALALEWARSGEVSK